MNTANTNTIPCGACNGAEYTGSGFSDADHCGACANGQAVCYCGEEATAIEDGDPVCDTHRDPVPAPADLCETARIRNVPMRVMVYGGGAL
jgi:hypothetical protein